MPRTTACPPATRLTRLLVAPLVLACVAGPVRAQTEVARAVQSERQKLEKEAADLRWVIDQIQNRGAIVYVHATGMWIGPRDQFAGAMKWLVLTGRLAPDQVQGEVERALRTTKDLLPGLEADLARVETELGRVILEEQGALRTEPPVAPSELSEFAGAEAHGEWSVGCPTAVVPASAPARSGAFSFRFASSGSPLVVRGELFIGADEWRASGFLHPDGTAAGTAAPTDRRSWLSWQGAFQRIEGRTQGSGTVTLVPAGEGAPCTGEWRTYR